MDFRLVEETNKFLAGLGLAGDYDLISLAGSTKEIANPSDGKIKEYIFSNIGVSYNLHQARKLIIIHHSDCGAYGGSAAFANAEKEKEFQISEMNKSASAIKEKYPEFDILKYHALKRQIDFFRIIFS